MKFNRKNKIIIYVIFDLIIDFMMPKMLISIINYCEIKGLGDIKFLKNKSTGAIRILMRREQVLKICANHRINSSMTIKEISNKQYSWLATDFSENEPKSELLLAKFKLAEEATEFKNEFEKVLHLILYFIYGIYFSVE